METDEVIWAETAALAQSITDQRWALDKISHGTEVMDDLIAVEGKGCGHFDDKLQCIFFPLPGRQCPRSSQGELLCSPREVMESGMWFVHPQKYMLWRLTQ